MKADDMFGRRSAVTSRSLSVATLAAAALALGACSSTSPRDTAQLTDEELDVVRSDPAVARLGGILDLPQTLLMTDIHSHYSVTAGGETIESDLVDAVTCAGVRCVTRDGTEISVEDLIDPSAGFDAGLTEAGIGSRDGFSTLTVAGGAEFSESLMGVTVSGTVGLTGLGFWGEHGYAALELGRGPLSGEVGGQSFIGEFVMARAYAAGKAPGTNPAGVGGATWEGIAEAASTGTFERYQGTATVTIADLSRPQVRVTVDVPGQTIGAPGWSAMPLTGGHFAAGTAGQDYLGGHFHGPDHSEAWGVFDTTSHIGVFGAKRAP